MDYTVWPLKVLLNNHRHKHQQSSNQSHPTSSSMSNSSQSTTSNTNKTGNKIQECKDPIQLFHESLHSTHRGKLFLRVCVSAGNSQYSPMKKIRVVEKRGLEIAQLNCSQLISPNQSIKHVTPKTTHNANKNNNKNEVSLHLSRSPPPPRPPPPRFNESKNCLSNIYINKYKLYFYLCYI